MPFLQLQILIYQLPPSSTAPSAGACQLWRCACGGRVAQSLSLSHEHTHTYTHTTITYPHKHTYTHTSNHICTHWYKRTVLSYFISGSHWLLQEKTTSCEICRYNSTSHGCVPSVPVTWCWVYCYIFLPLIFCGLHLKTLLQLLLLLPDMVM